MYNKYVMNNAPLQHEHEEVHNQKTESVFSALGSMFGGKMGGNQFTIENLIVIGVIYFILAGSDDFDIELLIIIGVLMFIGI